MSDLISIILPVYNGERYLRESIDSIIAQTYENWELIILDDCSTDDTAKIAQEYSKADLRIKYVRNEENLRLPRNLNKGFSLAKGNYLTWTSDDNKYKPEALQEMYNALCNDSKAQFVYASCVVIDENGKEYEYLMAQKGNSKYIVGSNTVGACFLYTREVYEKIGDYDPEYTLVEDFDYWQRICMKFKAVQIEKILYEYRQHGGNLTNTMKRDAFYTAKEKMLLKNRKGFGVLGPLQNYYYYRSLNECGDYLYKKDNKYARKYHFYSLFYFMFVRVPGKIKRTIQRKP